MVDTPGLQQARRPKERTVTAARGAASPGDHPPRRGGHRECRPDLPLLRHQPPVLLHLVSPLPGPGVEGLRDRSKRPLVSPRATHVEVVGKIIYLRQHYHFGPAKIAMYLKRYHEVQISSSGVWRILKRLDLTGCRPPSATSATIGAGSVMRSRCPATGSRST